MLDMTSRRTARQAIRFGIAQSLRNVRLVLLVWGVFLTLAWVAALPAWRWFDGVLSLAPEGDRLLSGLNIALLKELTHYDRSPVMDIALGSASTFFIIALILNPFVAAGILGVLDSTPSPRVSGERAGVKGVTRRFVGEGTRCYWPFARILLLVGILGAGVTMILTSGFEAASVAFDERGWPRVSMWIDNLMLVMWLIVFGLSSLIVDVSRILMLRRDDGRAAAAVRLALSFVLRNAVSVVAIGCAFIVLLVAAIAIYNLIASGITPLSWALIVSTILLQQLFALARTTLRVGLLAALATLIDAREPRPIEPPADVTPVDEPVYDLPVLG
jgi:hypothetical protein